MRSARALPCGPGAALVEVDDAAAVAALHRWLQMQQLPGLRALVPAARTVLVDGDAATVAALRSALPSFTLDAAAEQRAAGPTVEVPVVYDGEDLAWVADACGLSVEEVARRHAAPTYTAAFCGFAPGFTYLVGGDPALRVSRRDDPRARVPPGALAIAGDYSAVYPSASPGGWRLIGRALVHVWSVERDPPALIEPGATVRFVP